MKKAARKQVAWQIRLLFFPQDGFADHGYPGLLAVAVEVEPVLLEKLLTGRSVRSPHGRVDVDVAQFRIGLGHFLYGRIHGVHFFPDIPANR